ncbi:MAG: restriction endonuclease subunit S [Rivularia sp. (in: cyanobacteria)]
MNLETFFSNFELFADAPNGVQKLRELILQLAVQGKLVSQNHKDEPAAVLLEKIKAEKERLVKEGKIKKSKKLPPVDVGEMAFDLPQGWEWVRLGELTIFGPRNGYSPKPVEHVTSVKTLTLSATTSGKFDSRYFKYIDKQIQPDSHLWLENKDLLIQRANSLEYVGVAAIYKGNSKEFIYPDLMMKMRFPTYLNIDYLYQTINSENSRTFLRERASGTSGSMPKINQLTVNSLPFPLPPLNEQHCIVAKVNQMMSLCDELEAKLTQSIGDREKLMSAAVRQVLAV